MAYKVSYIIAGRRKNEYSRLMPDVYELTRYLEKCIITEFTVSYIDGDVREEVQHV